MDMDNLNISNLSDMMSSDEVSKVQDISIQCIRDILDSFHIALVNYDNYKEFLEKVPYKRYMDLAAVIRVSVQGVRYPVISNEFLEYFGLEWETLYDMVLRYRQEHTSFIFDTFLNVMLSFGADEADSAMDVPPIFLLTNKNLQFGSSVLLYEGITEDIYNRLGCEYAVIPANTNEVMIVPLDADETDMEMAKEIRSFVSYINEHILRPEEYLSDEIYYYDSNEKKLNILQ